MGQGKAHIRASKKEMAANPSRHRAKATRPRGNGGSGPGVEDVLRFSREMLGGTVSLMARIGSSTVAAAAVATRGVASAASRMMNGLAEDAQSLFQDRRSPAESRPEAKKLGARRPASTTSVSILDRASPESAHADQRHATRGYRRRGLSKRPGRKPSASS